MRGLIGIVAAGAAAALAGACSQPAEENAAANAGVNAAAAEKPKHPTYCFFKDANTKGWAAATDQSGNVVVSGKARLEDSRYRGDLVEGEAEGDKARIWLTMAQNSGAYAAPDNWWDVRATIPGSAAATSVTVMCGTKSVATLPVKR